MKIVVIGGTSRCRSWEEVITDPHARYFGAELGVRTLVAGDDASLGEIRFEDWLGQSVNSWP